MGKLRTIRRAVERNPEKWIHIPVVGELCECCNSRNYPKHASVRAYGVKVTWNGDMVPVPSRIGSYKKFVASVLRDLGWINAR